MLRAYTSFCRAQGMRDNTIRMRLVWLTKADRDLNLTTATTTDLIDWIATRPDWSPETRRAVRNALRSFYSWAQTFEHRTDNPATRLPSVRVPTAEPRPCPETIVHAALASAADPDRLMIGLAAFAGLRCCEIAALRWIDVTGQMLRVTGKGGKTRLIPISPALAELLDVVAVDADPACPWVFPGPHGALQPRSIGFRLKRILGGQWTAHTLRHRFATKAYAAQRDLLTVQRLLGHSKPETTARYAEPPAEAAMAAVLGAAA